MSQAIILKGGAGGVGSDDVTAGKAQVLQGYKTVTTDSDDEIAEGTIPNRGNVVDTVSFENAHWESKFVARMEEGYYGQAGQWKPCVAIPYAVMASVAGIDANKMLETLTVAGVRGTVHTYGAWNAALEVVNATWENKVHVRFEEGFYAKDGNYKPAAIVPYDVLANAIGIDASKMLSALNVLGKQGQIKSINTQDNNYRVNKSTAFGIDNWTDRNNPVFYVDFPHGNGFYHRADNHPHVCINADVLGDATADKVVAGSTFTSKNGVALQGKIVDRGDGAVVSFAQGREDWANRMWVTFKNGWYHRGYHPEGHEAYVFVTYEQIKNLFGIDSSKMLQEYSVAGVQGNISRWICTTGDVITALGGEGFVWDDTHANRGRGIVMKIPNGFYIQGANWAFLPSPNLKHWNIRKGVNINGEIGTMEDYGAGGVPFNGATFDNRLISGVANKGFILGGIPRFLNFKATGYGFLGIQDGGLKLFNGYGGNTHYKSASDVGFVLSKSINLTPFKYIKVGFKILKFSGDGTASQPARINLEFGVTSISNVGSESYHNESNTVLRDIGNEFKRVFHVMTSTRTNAGDISDKSQQYMTLDVSTSNGHHFIYFMLGSIVHEYTQGSVSAVAIINHIEFIN